MRGNHRNVARVFGKGIAVLLRRGRRCRRNGWGLRIPLLRRVGRCLRAEHRCEYPEARQARRPRRPPKCRFHRCSPHSPILTPRWPACHMARRVLRGRRIPAGLRPRVYSCSPRARRNCSDSFQAILSPPETRPRPISCTMATAQRITRGDAPCGHSSLNGRTTPSAPGW